MNDTGGEFSELVADTGTAATTYTDNTVAASTHYTYRIKAINEYGGERAVPLVPHRNPGGAGTGQAHRPERHGYP